MRGTRWLPPIVLLGVLGASSFALADPGRGDPRIDYMLQCQGCHLADGNGSEAVGVPRMTGFVGRFLQVEGGRAYLVQVPGVSQAPLDDAAIAALLNWILPRFSRDELPEPFVPYSAEEVKAYRSRDPIDVVAVRKALLSEIASLDPDLATSGKVPIATGREEPQED